MDYSLPYLFTRDLSGSLGSFYEKRYLWTKWGVLFPSWNVFYSVPNYGLNIFSELHYLFFVFLHGNLVYTYKVYIVFEILVCGVSMLIASYKMTKSRFGSLLAAIFYVLAPYFLSELQFGHIYSLWGYVLLPPAYYLTYRALINRSAKLAILAGGAVALATIFAHLQGVYTNGIPLAIFGLLITFFYANANDAKGFAKSVISRTGILLIMFSVVLSLSSYLIFPSIVFNLGVTTSNPYFSLSQSEVYSNSFLESFSLANIEQPYMPIIMFLAILSASLILLEKKKIYYALFIIGLLGILLSVGTNTPIFATLMKFIPFFNAIRTPGRFLVTTSFAFCLMAGVSIDVILKKLKHKCLGYARNGVVSPPHKRLPITVMILCFLSYLIILFPAGYIYSEYNLAYSNLGPLMHSPPQNGQQFLSSYTKIHQWLNHADPKHEYRVADLASETGKLFIFDHRTLRYLIPLDLLFTSYKSPSFAKILSFFGVKYLVSLTDPNEYLGYYQISFQDINNALSNSPYFEKVYQVKDLVIYENQLTMPWIFPAYGALTVGGPQAMSLFYSLNLTQNWALIYANQVIDEINNLSNPKWFNAIIFHDSDFYDLALMQMNSFIQPWERVDIYQPDSWEIRRTQIFPYDHPFFGVQNSKRGQIAYSEFFAYTFENARLNVPFNVEQTGNYSIWVRALMDYGAGSISIILDSDQKTTANFTGNFGFRWIKTGPYHLEKGIHHLIIENEQLASLYLDVIALISEKELNNQINQLSSFIEEGNLETIYLLEFTNYFSGEAVYPASWMPSYASNNGSLTMKPNSTVSTNVYIGKEGNYTIGVRLLVPSGDIQIEVDNRTVYEHRVQKYCKEELSWTWLITDPVPMTKGEHIIQVKNFYDNSYLDFMYMATGEAYQSWGWEDNKFIEGVTAQPNWVVPDNLSSNYSVRIHQGIVDFNVKDPGKSMKWSLNSPMDVNIKNYPYLVIRYKAVNISHSGEYALWFFAEDGDGNSMPFYPLTQAQLIDDNQWHTLTIDLTGHETTRVTKMAFQVQANHHGNAHLYIDYVKFGKKWSADPFSEMNLGVVDFMRTELTEWKGNLRLNKPAYLVFLESFDENRWSLQIENYSRSKFPLPVSYIFNAFPINMAQIQFKIHYSQPKLITVSNLISASTFVIISLFIGLLVCARIRIKLKITKSVRVKNMRH